MHQNQFWNLLAKHLAGEASSLEKEQLERLIKAHPELSFAAQHVTDMWKLQGTDDVKEAEAAFKKHLAVLSEEAIIPPDQLIDTASTGALDKEKRTRLQPFFIGAIAVILLGGFWLIKPSQSKEPLKPIAQVAEVSTRPGSRTKLILPDGSVVWLNAGSRLTYSHPFGATDRAVQLTGEAFFDVVKMSKPFIIHTEGIQIKVLGTAFNVRSYPSEKKIETSLLRGRVEVTLDESPEKKYVLKPNEKLTLNTEATTAIPFDKQKQQVPLAVVSALQYLNNSNTIAETSWVENKLVFVDESFADIAEKMESWYGVTINFKNEKVKAEHFTGVFEKETVNQALEAIQIAVPFHFITKDKEITITH